MIGLALTGVGVLVVLFVVYLFVFTPVTASRDQQRLAQRWPASPWPSSAWSPAICPPRAAPVAVLQIPVLHLNQVVVEGTSAADLMNGPGLLPGSALPGSPGNAVIAGRRVTFGGPFGIAAPAPQGDRIRVVDGAGTFTYRVTRTFTVRPASATW